MEHPTDRQAKILTIGLGVIAAMGLFPPWVQTWGPNADSVASAGYSLIFTPPPRKGEGYGLQIDLLTLSIQWVVTIAVFGIFWLNARQK